MDKQVDRKRLESRSCLFRRLNRRQVVEDVSPDKVDKVSSNSQGSNSATPEVDASMMEMASTSRIDGEILMSSEDYVRDNRSLLSLQPWIFRKANYKGDWERMGRNSDFSNEYGYEMNGFTGALLSPRNKGPQHMLGRSRSSIGSGRLRRCYVEPLNSVESCFMPQLYNDHLRIDEYVFSSLPSSPVSTLRPLLITDRSGIISRSSYDSSGLQPSSRWHKNADEISSRIPSETLFHKEAYGGSKAVIETLVGVPPLPKSRKPKRKTREVQQGSVHTSNLQRSCQISCSKGSLDSMLLFCLGISIGVVFTVLSNRIDVEKLNKLLKHSEDLVQDLQEELEMKDSLTVKELVNETCINQGDNYCSFNMEESNDSFLGQNSSSHLTAQKLDKCDSQHLNSPGENPELLSKIEAELEAELERLEQNINASDLQWRMSELSELDPDLIGDVVHGDLRADMLDEGGREGESDGNRSTNSNSTTHTYNANYSVSPKELSLRLHEVIQFRLEEQIKELETALLQNQRQLQFIEAKGASSQKAFSNSDIGSSSNQESPTVMQSDSASSNPLCLNLSGDALDAYNEAYKEFTSITKTKNPPSSLKTIEWIEGYMLNQFDRSPIWELEGGKGIRTPKHGKIFERELERERISWSREHSDTMERGEEFSEGDISDDEEGRNLIQQILEKTKQGSPAVMYAQRMLSLMDE